MSPDIDDITQIALALPDDQRALLADRLVESLDPSEESAFRDFWIAEARRRVDDVRSGRVETIPGSEGIERVRRATAK